MNPGSICFRGFVQLVILLTEKYDKMYIVKTVNFWFYSLR